MKKYTLIIAVALLGLTTLQAKNWKLPVHVEAANAKSVPSQNININVPNQILGGYTVSVPARAGQISVSKTTFHIRTTGGTGRITNIKLVDQNGAVVAGPVDAIQNGKYQTVTFTDTVTYTSGVRTFVLKGNIPNTFTNGIKIQAITIPSRDWKVATWPKVILSGHPVLMSVMTIKGPSLKITVRPFPASQTYVAGSAGKQFANLLFDANESSEDVRFSSLTLRLDGTASANGLNGCQIFDNGTVLNSTTVNPNGSGEIPFYFDGPVIIARGAMKTLTLRCNIESSAQGTYQWGIDKSPNVTGVSSGMDVIASVPSSNTGPVMTIVPSGQLIVSSAVDDGIKPALAGSSGVVVGKIRLTANHESIQLQQIGLKIAFPEESSPADVEVISVWNDGVKVGWGVFSGGSTNTIITLTTPVVIQKLAFANLVTRADLSQIGIGKPVTNSGNILVVDYDDQNPANTFGTGMDSGNTIIASGSAESYGVQIFKSYPTIKLVPLPTQVSYVGDVRLLTFSITASPNGPVSIGKMSFTVCGSNTDNIDMVLYGSTDATMYQPIDGFSNDGVNGKLTPSIIVSPHIDTMNRAEFYPQVNGDRKAIIIPAGGTYYFSVCSFGNKNRSIYTQFCTESIGYIGGNFDEMDVLPRGFFLWTPNTLGISDYDTRDWFNSFGLPELSPDGINQTRTQ